MAYFQTVKIVMAYFHLASILLFHAGGNLIYIFANVPMPLELTLLSIAGNW
jgi:hypothetical protein